MRILSFVMVLSLGISGAGAAASSAPTAPVDKELWDSLRDLNTRFRMVRAAKLVTYGYRMPLYNLYAGFPLLAMELMTRSNRLIRISETAYAVAWTLPIFAAALEVGLRLVDRSKFDKHNRVFGPNDPRRQAAKALLAIEDFFRRSPYEQYVRASQDPQLRAYVIQLDQWIQNGAGSVAPPSQPAAS